jgi:hypothetical protein
MLFCSQCAKNCRKLLASGQRLGVDTIQFGRAMEKARSEFSKTTEIVNKILVKREMPA